MLRHTYLGSFSLDPKDIRSLSLGTIWNFSKSTGLPWLWLQSMGLKGSVKGLCMLRPKGLKPIICCILFYLCLLNTGSTNSPTAATLQKSSPHSHMYWRLDIPPQEQSTYLKQQLTSMLYYFLCHDWPQPYHS